MRIFESNYKLKEYGVELENEFFEYDEDFLWETVCDDLAKEDWSAPTKRSKKIHKK